MLYFALTQHMSQKELRDFDRTLVAEPGKPHSPGASDLMRMLGGGKR